MKVKPRQSALTLMEMTVVIAVIAMLTVFGLPAIRAFFNSFESRGAARSMISAALASARAIAAKEQHYAGIRFQNRYQENGNGCQYMIFIVQDPNILAWGFRAVEGINPIRLPDSVGVMDLRTGPTEINSNSDINEERELMDTTTFSIIFSPSGKLVIHDVRVRNRDGEVDSNANLSGTSDDDIFNKKAEVDSRIAMFYQDDYFGASWSPYPDLGLGQEPSRRSFIIYDRALFGSVDENNRWSDYLEGLEVIYINPYTGTMINR